MRRTLLLSILIGSLGAIPCAHAQSLLENAGIGSVQAGAAGGIARAGRAFGGADRAVGGAVARHAGGGRSAARRGGVRGRGYRRNGNGVVVVYPGGYDGDYEAQPEAEGFAGKPVIIEGARQQAPQSPPASPKMTEIPAGKRAAAGKPAPPAIFVLKSGERIEAQHYLLTSRQVQLTSGRQQRTIPLSSVNLDETAAANRKRGLDLRVPSESSVISLGF